MLSVAALCAFCVACAVPTSDWYQEPESAVESLAAIECYRSGKPNIIVIGIDGSYAGCSRSETRRRVTPGSHRILLYALANDSFFSHGLGRFLLKRAESETGSDPVPLPEMSFQAAAGGSYRIHGFFQDGLAEFWITDNGTGRIAAISRLSRGDTPPQSVAKPGMDRPAVAPTTAPVEAVPSEAPRAGAGSSDIYCRPSFEYAGLCGQTDPNAQ